MNRIIKYVFIIGLLVLTVYLPFKLCSILPETIPNKELFSGLAVALLILVITKITEFFSVVISRKFKHLSSLNLCIAYLNRLSYSIKYNLQVLNARKENIEKLKEKTSFISNDLEVLPAFNDYSIKFSILNLEVINKLESLCFFVDSCNRNVSLNDKDHINLKSYHNELKEKFTEERRIEYRNKFVGNTDVAISELEKLKLDLVILLTIISNRFDEDYKDLDIQFFNLFFEQAKKKARKKPMLGKFNSKIKKEFKLDEEFSKRVIEEIETYD